MAVSVSGFTGLEDLQDGSVRIRIGRIGGLAGFSSLAENPEVDHVHPHFPSPPFVIRRRRIFTMNNQLGRCLDSRPYEVSKTS